MMQIEVNGLKYIKFKDWALSGYQFEVTFTNQISILSLSNRSYKD